MKIKELILITLTIYSATSNAQIFDNEQANSNIKWKQINTDKFQLIFPIEFSPTAQSLANVIDFQLLLSSENLQRKPRKLSIVIQENTIIQNGFVQLAPRKSEYYSTPSGIADNQAWLTNLSLHEVRHIAQFDNMTGNLRKPYGQQLALGLFALNLPSWYFEGDAVLHETLYSKGGRGRLPSWQMPIRTNIQSDLDFDFNKYVHGSFKDIVPSYYTIGYFMNSEIFQKNDSITSSIYKDMRSKLLRPFNFQRALKKNYGQNASGLFKKTMNNLETIWVEKPENIYKNRLELVTKYPTDYILPQVQNDKIYTIRQGPQRVNSIIEIDKTDSNNIEEITKLGAQIMPYFDIKKHLIVWDELRRNARYSKETFNIINIYNTQTKQKKSISYETRYYTPTLSPDLKNIACVEVDKANNSYLILIDILTEKKVKKINMPKNLHIQQPQYHPNGNKIVAIGVSEKGTNLVEIDLITDQISLLTAWNNQQIERPIYYNNDIIFKTNIDNKDDIFILKNKEIFKITDAQFGAFNPSLSDENLFFNDYTANGLKINHIDLPSIKLKKIDETSIQTLYPSQNNFNIPLTNVPTKTYNIEDYNTLSHAINFHSLSVSGSNFESFENLKPGIFLLSNDVLNTTQTKIGFEYDTEINKTAYSAEISYQKYYPKITVNYKNRGQIGVASLQNSPDSTARFDYRENMVTADVQIPFVKFRGNRIYSYGFNIGTSYQHRYDVSLRLSNFNKNISFPLNYQIYFSKNTRRSRMDIFPRWGQNFSFTYRHLPFEQEINGNSWSFRSNFYFPGFALNHGIQLRYAMQEQTGRFLNSNDIPLFSGITYIPFKNIKNTLLLDYRLPLSYPDWSLGQLTYLKRIYGGITANYLNIHNSNFTPEAISASVFFDFNVFKYTLPNFLLEAKATYITSPNTSKRLFPELSLSYNY